MHVYSERRKVIFNQIYFSGFYISVYLMVIAYRQKCILGNDDTKLAKISAILPQNAGTGGNCSSLAQRKQRPVPEIPRTGVKDPNTTETTTIFKKHYDRGDLPIRVNFDGALRSLKWWLDPKELDYKYYLPIFIEGLREKTEPYMFVAENGTIGMIVQGKDKIKDVLPDLIFPIKRALHTKDHDYMF